MNSPVMRYHGGKWRLAPWIMSQFPPHSAFDVYVEPFGGAAGVLLQKIPSKHEVYNDLDEDVVNVFRVLRDPWKAQHLAKLCRLTPFARSEFELAYQPTTDPVERARRTLFRASAGFGSASATAGTSGFRTYTGEDGPRGKIAATWLDYPRVIASYVERLQGVIIENRPALDVMLQHDRERALHYVDPPYLDSTRQKGHRLVYRHEMDEAEHIELLTGLKSLQGFVVLSGYDSELYRESLPGWHLVQKDVQASGQRGGATRTECLWLSPRVVQQQRQADMFATA
ncbi:DNA adenine methylase [Halomonas sp. E14]|uniref:DNA adenine methylase n=1 Tax=Halomonas sp. E14 TaxID=3397245 RepID=UPI00403EEBB8